MKNVVPSSSFNLYEYEITDTDWALQCASPCYQWLGYPEVRCGAGITCYQNHDEGKYVAYNLSLYHRYMQATYDWYRLEDEIGYNCEHTPWYKDYAEEVRKFLARIDGLKAFL